MQTAKNAETKSFLGFYGSPTPFRPATHLLLYLYHLEFLFAFLNEQFAVFKHIYGYLHFFIGYFDSSDR